MKTTRYLVLKVEVEHEPDADIETICEEVEVFLDVEEGAITKSEVLDVLTQRPKSAG